MSNDSSAAIVSKVWNYAHVLKNAGVVDSEHGEDELDRQITRSSRRRQAAPSSVFSGSTKAQLQ